MHPLAPRPTDCFWHWRERWRCRDSAREQGSLPWQHERWWRASLRVARHYARPSSEDPEKIAYTPNATYGEADRQLRTRPGRYLKKYFGHTLSQQDISYWAQQWNLQYSRAQMSIATTREEIRWVYENGPSSCMSHDCEQHAADGETIHPCEIYAAGDLGVAYLKDPRTDEDHITARALVHLERRVYSTIYGDEARLRPALLSAGYRYMKVGHAELCLSGARLLKIETHSGRQLIGPYLDGGYGASLHGDGLIVDCHPADFNAGNTYGILGELLACDDCGDDMTDDESNDVAGDETVCDACHGDHYFACESCGVSAHVDVVVRVGEDASCVLYCPDCAERHTFCCDACGTVTLNADAFCTTDDKEYCPSCATDHISDCEICEDAYSHEHPWQTTAQGEQVCRDCAQHEDHACVECEAPTTERRGLYVPGRVLCSECGPEQEEAHEEQRESARTAAFAQACTVAPLVNAYLSVPVPSTPRPSPATGLGAHTALTTTTGATTYTWILTTHSGTGTD